MSHYDLDSEVHVSEHNRSIDFLYPTPSPKKLRVVERLREVRQEVGRDDPVHPLKSRKRAPSNVARMFHFRQRNSSSSSDEILTQNKRERYGLAKHNEDADNKDHDNDNPDKKRRCGSEHEQVVDEGQQLEDGHEEVGGGDQLGDGHEDVGCEEDQGTVRPILNQWVKYSLFESLSDFDHGCKLFVCHIKKQDGSYIIQLHDSEVKIDATLAPRCQSHVPFLKSGCVVRIMSTHGGPDDLTVVSYVDL